MKIKTYRATDRTAALKQIREELGPEAVIVYERRRSAGALSLFGLAGLLSLFGRSYKPEIEILAAVEDEHLPGAPSAGLSRPGLTSLPPSPAARTAGDQRIAGRPAAAAPAPGMAGGVAGRGAAGSTVSVASSGSGAGQAGRSMLPASAAPSRAVSSGSGVGQVGASGAAGAGGEERPKLPASEPAGRRSAASAASLAPERRARPAGPSPGSSAGRAVLYEMQRTLTDLRGAVNRLTWQAPDGRLAGESPVLQAISQHLVAQEVEPTLALSLVAQLSDELHGRGDPEPERVCSRLGELLGERLRTAGLTPPGGAPLVVFLIGPTGVGKTTTLAKLAAHLSFAEGRQVGLVTTDTFRIAATSQLGTYAEIMRLPIEVTYQPAELAAVVGRYRHVDLLLVDTPGCAQGNEAQLAELARFLAAVPPAQRLVLLVMAAPTKLRDLLDIEERFGRLGPDGLILTKLDETGTYGPILSVVARSGRPVYFITSGQNVPSDIEAAASPKLVQLATAGLSAVAARTGAKLLAVGDPGPPVPDGGPARGAARMAEPPRTPSGGAHAAGKGAAESPANGAASLAAEAGKRGSGRPSRGAALRRRRMVEGAVE